MNINFLIVIVGIIFLVVLGIWLYPLIKILSIRLVFGKYSARYISVYKMVTGKSPFAYCIKDDFLNHIAAFYQKINSIDSYDTKSAIGFADTPFGTKFKMVLRKNGRPLCVNAHRLGFFDIKVLGYRETLFNSNTRKHFFFLNNRFFMGEYLFKESGPEKIAELARILHKKYLEGIQAKSDNFLIRGANQTYIRFEHSGFYLCVKYLDRSDGEIAGLLDQFWTSTVKKPVDNVSSFEEELSKKL
ncbi:MAG: hypothetical protein ACLFPE_05735 [Bacteroidales bacterium]